MRVIARVVSGCALAGALVVVGGATSAHADLAVSQVGWWTRAPSAPTVPEGGIAVGAAPDGDLTVGAVVVDAGDRASGIGLRLVETGGQGQAIAAIVVCPTTATWAPADGGAMADAPPDDGCDAGAVPMTRGDDGTWTADLRFAEGQSGPIGFLVKPAAGSVAFQISFAPPNVTGTASTPTGGDTVADEPATEPAPSSSASSSPSNVASSPPPASIATPTTAATLALPSSVTEASEDETSSEVATPVFGGVPAAGGGDESDVSAATVVSWYVLAGIVGVVVAGLAWARNEGRLSLEGLVTLVRLRR